MHLLLDNLFFGAGIIPGGPEVLWIVGIILLLFGAKKIPELMRGLGGGIKEFKKAAADVSEPVQEVKSAVTDVATSALKDDKAPNLIPPPSPPGS